jgi:hypothetical protein
LEGCVAFVLGALLFSHYLAAYLPAAALLPYAVALMLVELISPADLDDLFLLLAIHCAALYYGTRHSLASTLSHY